MLRFEPEYKVVLWGGRRLARRFARPVPDGPVGEAWELVEIEGHESRTAGPAGGRALGELWRAGALGGSARGAFPFLLKWLDTEDRLSVQVHPDEAACARLRRGRPKTEAWYVAHAEPRARIFLGHHPGLDAQELRRAATGGEVARWLRAVTPRAGDMFLVPAGTLHAIGPGLLLLEIQQPSDTTFRVYDWDRVDADGRGRELHLDAACESVRYARHGAPRPRRRRLAAAGFSMAVLGRRRALDPADLRVLVAAGAPVRLRTARGEARLGAGEVAVGEPADGPIRRLDGPCLVLSEAPAREAPRAAAA